MPGAADKLSQMSASLAPVSWGDLDIVKLAGHMYKKRYIKSLNVSNLKLITAIVLAVIIIVTQLFVPFLLQYHVSAAMFCGDMVK